MAEWKEKRLADLLTQRKEQVIIKPQSEYSLVTITNKGEVKLREKKTGGLIRAKKGYVTKAGDFIYSRLSVHTGAFGIVPESLDNALITNEMPSFQIDELQIHPQILLDLVGMPEFQWKLKQLAKGMGRVRIKESMLLNLQITFPEPSRQQHFVDKMNDVKRYRFGIASELTHQQTLLKKLRQQILQEAIEGKLTADWRQQNPDVEPASELLARIQEEKAKLIKERKIKKQNPLPPIREEEKPFALPEGWEWLKIEYFLEYKKRGMITGPFGTALQKSEHQLKGVPVFGIETIKNGLFTYKNKIFVTLEKADKLSSFRAKPGDIIISRSGTIDEICVIPSDTDAGLISTNLLRVSLVDELVDSAYFCYLFKGCVPVLEQLKELCSGSTRLFLNQKILKALIFPVPSLPEQKTIVTKVEKLLSLCDQIEAQITDNQTHAEQLMQAVLKEAFSQTSDLPCRQAGQQNQEAVNA